MARSKKAPANQENKVKRLDEYSRTKPEQLDMFQLMLPDEKRFSNTIELYDFIPKYFWGKAERVGGKFLDSLMRKFECRGNHYTVEIKPASIRDKQGVERYYYPSKREEVVEDALRKLAAEGHGVFLDDHAGVTFTLYQLQEELKRNGHSYSKAELKNALMICAQTHLVVTSEDGNSVLLSSLFETVGLHTREDWQGQGQKTKAFVRFNPLVTASIKNKTFRLYNYETSMGYKSVIARQLHKRMAHMFTQASVTTHYSLMLTTIIRDFGLTAYDRPSHNLRDVIQALEEMKEKQVVLTYKVEKVLDTSHRNKLIDAKIHLTPHPNFSGEVIRGNDKQIAIDGPLARRTRSR